MSLAWFFVFGCGSRSDRDKGIRFYQIPSGKSALSWHKYDVDWLPTLQLGKKNNRPKLDHDANAERAERVKKRKQLAVKRKEREAAEKRQNLVESSLPAAQIDFSQPSTLADFSQPSTEQEGNRNEGNEEAFSSDMAAIQVMSSESEEIEPETVKDAECQTTEFDYMFQTSRYQVPNKNFFASDDKVHFYTGLPSMEVLS